MIVRVRGRRQHHRTVTFDARRAQLRLIDQRLLPHRFQIIDVPDFRGVAWAIREMVVRGAGAIGATAAYGLAQGALAFRRKSRAAFKRHMAKVFAMLEAARPTAIDPVNAM